MQGSSVPSAPIFAAYEYLGQGPSEDQQAPGPRLTDLIPPVRAGNKIKIFLFVQRAPGPRSDAGRVQAPADRPQAVEKWVYGPHFSMTEDGTRKHEATREGSAPILRPPEAWSPLRLWVVPRSALAVVPGSGAVALRRARPRCLVVVRGSLPCFARCVAPFGLRPPARAAVPRVWSVAPFRAWAALQPGRGPPAWPSAALFE